VSFVLAALDNSASARAVLDAAMRIGRLTGTPVRAVYVRTDPLEPFDAVESTATRAQVPLRVVEGPLEPTLIAALGDPEVIVAAIGAWSGAARTEPYPTGHTARALLEHADKPVVVVPPATGLLEHADKPVVVVPPATGSPGAIRRILLPLEGTEGSSCPVLERLLPLLADQVELVVLHVFTDATVPVMLDRPEYDIDILGREFLNRHFPDANRVELRTGSVVEQVAAVSADQRMDLIVLSWSQSPSPERASVVRGVLSGSALPVLLLPLASPGYASADGHAVGSVGPGTGPSRSEGRSGSPATR
jgi:nucleotide-binding universal stress UspA family protein